MTLSLKDQGTLWIHMSPPLTRCKVQTRQRISKLTSELQVKSPLSEVLHKRVRDRRLQLAPLPQQVRSSLHLAFADATTSWRSCSSHLHIDTPVVLKTILFAHICPCLYARTLFAHVCPRLYARTLFALYTPHFFTSGGHKKATSVHDQIKTYRSGIRLAI